MKLYQPLVSEGQSLQLPATKFFTGLVLSAILSLFLSYNSNFNSAPALNDHSLQTCDNVTSGGTIDGDQTNCTGFDPDLIVNVVSPSGGSGAIQYLWLKTTDCTLPVSQWEQVPNSNSAAYNPGFISETTCFIRCSRRAGCSDWNGESNIVTMEVTDNCPDEDWDFTCDDGKKVELIGKGIKNNVPVTLDFDIDSNIYQVVVEIVYKGGNPGNSISVYDEFGIPYLAYREQPVGGSSNVYVYRALLPGTASVTYQNQSQENKAQSIVAYLFRNDNTGIQSSGYFTHISGYHDVQTLNFTIPVDVAPRNIDIELPVSEMTPDCRILNITATAGSVSEMITIDGPDGNLGCCLNIANITLNDVPGNITTLEIEVESPSGSNSGCPSTPNHNGQSYVIAGAVKVDVECVCPDSSIISCLPDISLSCDSSLDPDENDTLEIPNINCYNANEYTLTYSDSISGTCPVIVTRTWTAEGPGGSASCTQEISLLDDNAPVLSNIPDDVTVECDSIPVAATPDIEDDCDSNAQILFEEVSTQGNNGVCTNTYLITRTWTAIDACGNARTVSQTITVEDTTAPELLGVPSDITVACNAVPQAANPTATDNCDTNVEITYEEFQTDADCPAAYFLTRTWTATDNCGNSVSLSQNITVEDSTGPELTGIPADVTVECDNIPAPASPTATDDCYTVDDIQYSEIQIDGDCTDNYIIKRTWTVADNCGNETSESQNITVEDTTDPVLSGVPGNTTVECDAIPTATSPTATDNCDTEVEIEYSENKIDGPCENAYTLIRTWIATDNCGNQVTQVQKVEVEDTTDPTLSGVPSDITVACNAVPQAANPTATDNCDTNVEITYEEVQTDADCPAAYVLTRTWTATDNCGNSVSLSQTITVEDSTGPELTGIPADVTVECDNIPAPASPTTTDDCYTVDDIQYSEIQIDGDCTDNYIIKRTWTVADNCGNETSESQNITVEDTTDPVLSGVPGNTTVECDAIPTATSPTATDNCDTEVEIEYSENKIDGPCENAYTLIRTWIATDNCGNQVTQVQKVEVEDTTDPTLSGVPSDITVACNAVPQAANPTATDNCDTNVEITYEEVQTDADCPAAYVLTRTWTATDNCGNTTSLSQTITVEDSTGPELTGIPADVTVECDNIPAPASPTATDDCYTVDDIEYSENKIDGPCENTYTLIRTWTATDNCGNQVTQIQKVEVEDTTDPTLSGVPSDITVACNAVPQAANPTATDNCDTNVEITYEEVQTDADCPAAYVLTRTWTATDNCGNTTSLSQNITVEDSTGPELTGVPADVTVECDNIPAVANPTATDDCYTVFDIQYSELQIDGDCTDNYIIKRTWTVLDNCGNETSESQNITVEDTTDPVLSGVPGNTTVECDAIPTAASPTATDNCDTEVEIEYSENKIDGPCENTYTLIRTWTATDNCGNQVTQVQKVEVEDTTDPTLSGVPSDITVACNDVPQAANPTATDNCDTNVEINFEEVQTDADCPAAYVLTRTWTATDNCGNSVSLSQNITVEDSSGPELTGIPADVTVECDNIPAPASPTATDDCYTVFDIQYSEIQVDGDCTDNYIIKRTWTVADNCGNETSESQNITVEDTTDPVLSGVPGNTTVECDAIPTAASPTATDNCDTEVEIEYSESKIDGPCENAYTLIRTWIATDNCGNQVTQVQKVEVEDTTDPTLSGVPSDITVSCNAVPQAANPTATDNCDTNVEITYEEVQTDADCPAAYVLTRTWTATDNCGNSVSLSQNITVEDSTGPELTGVPADVTVECDNIPAPASPTATDDCYTVFDIQYSEIQIDGDCTDNYIIKRTWTVLDNCGNETSESQNITVEDTTDPVLSGVPGNTTVECDAIPTAASPTATDNCDTEVEIEYSENKIDGSCENAYTLIRTWIATDNCGNQVTSTQNISVQDSEGPILSGIPSDITTECDNIPAPAIPTATDNCDTNVEISFSETQIAGNCQDSYSLVRTWTATDNCGNMTQEEQIISVFDTTEPVLTGTPSNITVECNMVPAPPVIGIDILATDNCDTNVEIALFENIVPGPCTDSYELVRSWFATDNCGNLTSGSHIITVIDTTDPELLGVPADITLSPGQAIPDPANVTATDNCDNNVEILFSEIENSDGCMTIIIRTWEAIDNCGNSVQESQIIVGANILNVVITPANPIVCAGENIEFSSNQTDPSYTYTWSSNGGSFDNPSSITPVYTNLTPGTYQITLAVSSAMGCEGTASTTVTIFEEPAASASSNSPVCEGANILLFASGGTSYFWNGPNGYSSFEQNPVIEDAELTDAGLYTVMVMIGDCGNTASVEVVVTEEITADFNVINADCDSPGSINIGAFGGSGVYTYDWADLPGNDDPEDRNGLSPGTYSVTIYDTGGCSFAINTINIGDDCGCEATSGGIVIDSDIVCLENGTATLTATPDGTALVPAGYTTLYLLTSGSGLIIIDTSTFPEFIVTQTGIYAIHPFVYDPLTFDINLIQFGSTTIFDIHFLLEQGGGSICGGLNIPGASASVYETIANIESISPAGCDLCNGAVTMSPTTLLYQWSDGGNGPARINLCPGTYEVTATDTNSGCNDILTVIIEEDCFCIEPLVEDIQIFDADCGEANGAVNITMSGAESDYNYAWWPNIGSTNDIGNNRVELVPGFYSITITDPNMVDCPTVLEIIVGDNDGPQDIEFSTINATCGEANGSATILPANYNCIWIMDQMESNTRNDLLPGSYKVVVIDPLVPDCPEFITIEIGDDSSLQAEAQIISLPTCDLATGSVQIDVTGLVGSPSFNWSDNAALDTDYRTNLGVGEYAVTVTDNETGCTVIVDFLLIVQTGDAIIEITNQPSLSCAGDAFGLVEYNVTFLQGFEQPATIIIEDENGDTVINGQLSPGSYCVLVSDANGCLADQACFEVAEPEPLVADIAIENADCQTGGIIDIEISGGEGVYTYNWLDLPGTDDPQDREDISSGNYSVTVIDENGCKLILDDLFVGDDCLDCMAQAGGINADSNPACLDNGSANITATPDGTAVAPTGYVIVYLLTNGAGLTVVDLEANPEFAVTDVGTYAIHPFVFDPLTFDLSTILFGTTTIFDIHFMLEQGGGTICGGLNIPGASMTVSETVATIESITPDHCEACDGTVTLSPSTYLYQWSDSGNGAVRTNLCDGSYEVTATNSSTGCSDILTVVVEDEDCGCTATSGGIVADVNPACLTGNSIKITANPDGTAVVPSGYTTIYLLSSGAGLTITKINDIPDFSIFDTGIYSIHPFVYDPATFDINTIVLGTTTIFDLHFMLIQGGGTICGGLNIPGASITVFEAIATIENITPDECEACNGSVTLTPSTYLYQWSDNGNGAIRTNLCDGSYEVTATDTNTGCTDVLTVIVGDLCNPCPNPDTVLMALTVFSQQTDCVVLEDCFDAQETTYLLLNGNTTGNSSFGNWDLEDDGCLTYESGGMIGNYVDTICVVANYGGLLDTTCFIVSIIDEPINVTEIDTLYLTTLEGVSVDTCLSLDELNGNYASNAVYYEPLNGTGVLELDQDNPCFNFIPNPGITGDFIDTLGVIICDDIGVCDTTIVIISIEAILPCPDLYSGNDTISLVDCGGLAPICLEIPLEDVLNYTVSDNGLPYTEGFLGCDFDSLITYLAISFSDNLPYSLNWVVNGNVLSVDNFNNLQELVDSMNILDPNANWELNGVLIVGGNFSNLYGQMSVAINGNVIATANPNIQLVPNGVSIQLDSGYHEVILTDVTSGCVDTFEVFVSCIPVFNDPTDTIETNLLLGFSDTLCLDTSIFANDIELFFNDCFTVEGPFLEYELDDENYCVYFTGIQTGSDTLCLVLCDITGACDTTVLIVNVYPPVIDTILTSVLVGETDTICLDTTELAGMIVSIDNYCEGSSGTFVDFELLDDYCISYGGLNANGTDTACLVICDEFGFCDTTILITTVIDNPLEEPPVAVNDSVTVLDGASTLISVLENDTLNGNLIDVGIVDQPQNGTVDINLDFTITYTPNPDFCGGVDSFTYFITTAAGSDTATVYIEVLCQELTVFTGMSPNGDGINDYFAIVGIEAYQENTVTIFNRWGNQVFQKEGYTNNDPWYGTWKNKDLPDGTYFYLIEAVNDEGNVIQLNGYLQIHR